MEKIILIISLSLCGLLSTRNPICVNQEYQIFEIGSIKYLKISINFENKSNEDVAMYIQNWRCVFLPQIDDKIFGYPHMPNMVNRIYIMNDSSNLSDKIGIIEDHNYGYIYDKYLKKLSPKEKFKIAIFIEDSIIINWISNNNFKIIYQYNYAFMKDLNKIFSQNKVKYTFASDDLILPKLHANKDNTMNSFSIKEDAAIKYDIDIINFNNLFTKTIIEKKYFKK